MAPSMRPQPLSPLLVALLWLLQGAFAAAAADTLPVAPFEARYKVYGTGVPVGEAVMVLSESGNGGYMMRSDMRPTELVSLFVSQQLSERANGEFREGMFRPSSYVQERQDGKESHTVRLSFDWPQASLLAQSDGKQATLPLAPGVMDPLSLQLAVMYDLAQGRTPRQYTLVDKTELKTYMVTVEGEETLNTGLGRLPAVRISRHKPGGSRTTTFWFAPTLQYLIVQVSQKRNGAETLRMTLQEAKGRALAP